MNVDSIFLKGRSHRVCEDYAITGRSDLGYDYAIVADGCSSGYRSDVAARMIATLAEKLVKEDLPFYMESSPITVNRIFLEHLKLIYDHQLRALLSPESLLSTLIVLMTKNDQARVLMFGDGYVFTHTSFTDMLPSWIGRSISFSQSAPRYPAYSFDKNLTDQYDEQFKDQRVTRFIGSDKEAYVERSALDLSARYGEVIDVDLSTVDAVVISSDGIGTFDYNLKENEILEGHASELLAFKAYNGSFLERRVLRATEDLAKIGVYHDDDIGLAAIHI